MAVSTLNFSGSFTQSNTANVSVYFYSGTSGTYDTSNILGSAAVFRQAYDPANGGGPTYQFNHSRPSIPR